MKINKSEKTNISDLHVKLKILIIYCSSAKSESWLQSQYPNTNIAHFGVLWSLMEESIWVKWRKTKLIKQNIVLSFYVVYLSFEFNITFWDFKTDTSGILFSFPIYMSVIIPQSCRTAFLTDIRSRFRTVETTPVRDPWWSERKRMHW